ncbi:MAG: hypothetical protein ACXVPQ_07680 [Bacteroidia bacterium]
MRATNIKHLLELKKQGVKVRFVECPACQCFFGTNEDDATTCSRRCEMELEELSRKIEQSKELIYNRKKRELTTLHLNTIFL